MSQILIPASRISTYVPTYDRMETKVDDLPHMDEMVVQHYNSEKGFGFAAGEFTYVDHRAVSTQHKTDSLFFHISGARILELSEHEAGTPRYRLKRIMWEPLSYPFQGKKSTAPTPKKGDKIYLLTVGPGKVKDQKAAITWLPKEAYDALLKVHHETVAANTRPPAPVFYILRHWLTFGPARANNLTKKFEHEEIHNYEITAKGNDVGALVKMSSPGPNCVWAKLLPEGLVQVPNPLDRVQIEAPVGSSIKPIEMLV